MTSNPRHPTDVPIGTFPVVGWRFVGSEAAYERTTVVAGGPVLFGALAVASAVGNRRRRRQAERLAAPQWRPLGPIAVVVTGARLQALHEGAWASVWLDAVTAGRWHPGGDGITLFFADDPPYAFTGPWAGLLAAEIDRALAARRASGHGVEAEDDDPGRCRFRAMDQDLSVRNAVASARLEGVELEPAVVAILEAAAAGEMTSDEARRKILAEHGVELPAGHRLAHSVHAR